MPGATVRELREGAALALTTFTVAPVRAKEINRRTAAAAMSLAPAVGALLGFVIGGLALLLRPTDAPPLLIGAVCVAAAALLTRGLHLDGLSDTMDALGSYRSRERALAIMKSPEVGPFGVAAIVLALLVPAAAISGIVDRAWWQVLCGIAAGFAAGRAAATWACRRGLPAARPEGLGALVAGTVGAPAVAIGTVLVAALSVGADWGRPWHGPLSVAAGLTAAGLLVWQCVRRLGGVTGDVLGAGVEIATAVTLAGLCL